MTILLVRHARAGRRDKWQGDDRLRPLTKRGQVQAQALPALLAPWLLGDPLILSSPWVRCMQTLEPLARSLGGEVKVDDALGEGRGPAAVDALAGWCLAELVVLCTHGDVIEETLSSIAGSGVDLGGRAWAAKGAVWVLECKDRTVATARYLAPV